MKLISSLLLMASLSATSFAQKVDYSVLYVNEESGINFTRITGDNDYVCLPIVNRRSDGLEWLTNSILDISTDGQNLAYLSARNNTSNIFIKDLSKQGSSIQRTNRQAVLDFTYSPDGKHIVFSEMIGDTNQVFQTDASNGYRCRQITSGSQDYSPVYDKTMEQIFFARQELNGISIWSYNMKSNFLSSFTTGFNPCPYDNESILCARLNSANHSEIWRINLSSGMEECIVSDPQKSFSTPSLSPNKKWILMVGTGILNAGGKPFYNTDIYVCRTDGTDLRQLTYHAADDLSPVWSKDGNYIYFISQRGSSNGTANVWRMDFQE